LQFFLSTQVLEGIVRSFEHRGLSRDPMLIHRLRPDDEVDMVLHRCRQLTVRLEIDVEVLDVVFLLDADVPLHERHACRRSIRHRSFYLGQAHGSIGQNGHSQRRRGKQQQQWQ
jgi:hypothetical protein